MRNWPANARRPSTTHAKRPGKFASQAAARLNEERSAAAQELFSQTVQLAISLAERLLGELALPSLEHAFLTRALDYLDHLPADEIAALVSHQNNAALVVTTAHPLDASGEAEWRAQLAKRIGAGAIQFNSDRRSSPAPKSHFPMQFSVSTGATRSRAPSKRSIAMSTLADAVKDRLSRANGLLGRLEVAPRLDLIGRVERVGDNVASVRGLPETRLGELLLFERSDGGEPVVGIVLSLDPELIGCAMLGDDGGIRAGNLVRGTGTVASVPVGAKLLGRTVNALGVPLDGGPEIEAAGVEPVERPAPAIVDRDFVDTALNTGLLVIDAMLALGRGQRELIIGDRETGKTAIAIDTIINQRDTGVVCVYCAVGQKTSSVSQVIDAVKRYGAPERCIFVFAPSDDPPGIQWLAPYAACTMAEYFSERGGDALLIIDDLSKHAVIYRQLSLLLRNPPGREAYPGDIFYIHSRLLERAAKLSHERGGGSLTALPLAATEEGNLSAYIPTNLISIADGQIVLEPRLFHEGQKPAVNVGKSVSRVGGKTQSHAMRKLAENLRLEYTQFLELEIFTRFGGMVDERTRAIIEHGRRIRAVLTQPQFAPLSVAHQLALLVAIDDRLLDQLPLDKVSALQSKLGDWLNQHAAESVRRINTAGEFEPDTRAALVKAVKELVASLNTPGAAPAKP